MRGFIVNLNSDPSATLPATPLASKDVRILNFALLLEYMERNFDIINLLLFSSL